MDGLAPHQWLLAQRALSAKEGLLDPALSLDAVAKVCGFADQSHFTRLFLQIEGVTPGRWRKNRDIRALN
ncbi:MAG: helix-turn-helix transcriptional regulator [Sphingobium sp.]|nr:helix-turn-helix transcriptional regulator [Sphingobium sp.]